MIESIDKLATQGVLGLLLAISLFALGWAVNLINRERAQAAKDLAEANAKTLAEKELRVQDGKETRDLVMKVQSATIDATAKLAEVLEFLTKTREEELRRGGPYRTSAKGEKL